MTLVRFVKFIIDEIFPGGDLPKPSVVLEHAASAGFEVQRCQRLRPHYVRTLEMWAAALADSKARAIALQSQEMYDRYMRYLTGCAELFRDGYTDVCQFTLTKAGG